MKKILVLLFCLLLVGFGYFLHTPLEDKLIGDNYSGQPDGTYKMSGTTNMVRGEATCSWINDYVW